MWNEIFLPSFSFFLLLLPVSPHFCNIFNVKENVAEQLLSFDVSCYA
ncbi:unnamed protein product [Larinioides sclopetarius]|uniref:Uncharacterized protein n=1 Tax=Larinioides sclopetarius TaxID=280406 RepID=A0AAV1YWB6_9ARAC